MSPHIVQENALFSGKKLLHTWQKNYTTAGHGGRDTFQLCICFVNIVMNIRILREN